MHPKQLARASQARAHSCRLGLCGAPVALGLALEFDGAACEAANARGFTDGTKIVLDPEWFAAASRDEVLGLLAHECLHNDLDHPGRGADLLKEGIALEHVQAGAEEEVLRTSLATGKLAMLGHAPDPQWAGHSMEAIARALHRRQQGSASGAGQTPPPQGAPVPGNGPAKRPFGGTIAPMPDTPEARAARHTARTQALARAAGVGIGSLPADLARLVRTLRKPAVRDLYAALLDWRAATTRGAKETDWARADRYASALMGAYLPGRRRRGLPHLGAAVDTSGSVGELQLVRFRGAVARLLDEEEPECIHAFAADARIQARYRLEPGDPVPEAWPGGGGTDFRPVFAALAGEEDLAGLVYLTDLQGAFPAGPPSFPVLWVIDDPAANRPEPPFGSVVFLD